MKKQLLLIVAVLALSAFAFAEFKVGIINPQAVLQGSVKGKEAIGRLQAMQAAKQKKYEALQAEIDALEKEIGSPALNADAREKKSQDLIAKRTEIKRFAEDAQKESLAVQEKEFGKIQADLMPLIEKIAKENGYAMVFDLTTSGVTFFEPAIDITDKVIKAYDAQSAAAPAAKK
ncbi:MAG TPA: OmpH family outer membrane protein [Candidatus Aminicenantes bacterium]|nr:OmpH family outer membrane protein [Candidatus Aminicenantes bacterium]